MILTSADTKKLIAGMVAGALIGVAVVAGTYAVAATAAGVIAASFTSAQTARYTRIRAIATAETRVAAEYQEARADCERLTRTKKHICIAKANAQSRRALRSARQLAASDAPSQW
jgi:uncharacterized protein YcfJ